MYVFVDTNWDCRVLRGCFVDDYIRWRFVDDYIRGCFVGGYIRIALARTISSSNSVDFTCLSVSQVYEMQEHGTVRCPYEIDYDTG
ncbi:hypothetical protein [Microcoleus anatoxicus]|uniref:Uncharacterized protein n=1 Tax=Microcoleus anatoxicus PTRS2 TaxID=2705321 RepID=A0ABU8YYM0_9CYAN